MGFWENWFNKPPTTKDIQLQLKETEREQKKARRQLKIKEQLKNDLVRRAMRAKKEGNSEELRDIFREIRGLEIDKGFISKELHRLSLTKVALASMIRKIGMFERKNDNRSIQNLIMRFKNSKIQKIIDKAEVEEDAFLDVLEDILGEEEEAIREERVKEDSGFAEFDRAIDAMVRSEESGEDDPEEFSRLRKEIDQAIKSDKSPEDKEWK